MRLSAAAIELRVLQRYCFYFLRMRRIHYTRTRVWCKRSPISKVRFLQKTFIKHTFNFILRDTYLLHVCTHIQCNNDNSIIFKSVTKLFGGIAKWLGDFMAVKCAVAAWWQRCSIEQGAFFFIKLYC